MPRFDLYRPSVSMLDALEADLGVVTCPARHSMAECRRCARRGAAVHRSASVLAVLLTCLACKPRADPAYLEEVEAWHRERVDRLTAEEGWLSLAGLFWAGEKSYGPH